MTSFSLLGIIAAGLVPVLLGAVWYHPRVFGTQWMRLSGISPEMVERARRRRASYLALAFGTSILIAYVMDAFGISAGVSGIFDALRLGFWCWAGFVVPLLLGSVIWEGRSARLYFINIGYWLLAFLLMAIVLFI